MDEHGRLRRSIGAARRVLELLRDEEVAGSNPVTPTTKNLVRAIWLDQESGPGAEYSSKVQQCAARHRSDSPNRRNASCVAFELALA
jgi:hypothetical protein